MTNIIVCPYCKQNAVIADRVFMNLEIYGGSKVARTTCCNAVVRVSAVLTFTVRETEQVAEDDWGG